MSWMRWSFGLQWHLLSTGELVLLSESREHLFRGRAYPLLAPLLEQPRTEQALLEELQDQLPLTELLYALEQLKRAGCISVAKENWAEPDAVALGEALQVPPDLAARRWCEQSVTLHALGNTHRLLPKAAFAHNGIQLSSFGALSVVLVDHYLCRDLAPLNAQFLGESQAWMVAKPQGREIWLGPLFVPGETGCWECLAHRFRRHRPFRSYVQSAEPQRSSTLPPQPLPAQGALAISLVALEVSKSLLLDHDTPLRGKLMTLDTLTWERQFHTLTRRPQCPSCGDPAAVSAQPIALRPAEASTSPGFRSHTPTQVLARLEPQISPIAGLVDGLYPAPSPLESVFAFYTRHESASHEWKTKAKDLDDFQSRFLDNFAFGQGWTEASARVSALCEAIERYSGSFHGDEPRHEARYEELGDEALHPNTWALFSPQQFEDRARWNAKGELSAYVPLPFDPQAEIEWSPFWSLSQHQRRYLPTACAYHGYQLAHEAPFALTDSNGCASGSSLEEAILYGLFELVERDAVAIWWYNRLARPALELSRFGDPRIEAFVEQLEGLGRELWVLDVTTDLGIPAVVAVSRRKEALPEAPILGFGAHLSCQSAVLSALLEIAQMLPIWDHVLDHPKEAQTPAQRWILGARVEGHTHLQPQGQRAPQEAPYSGPPDPKAAIEWCVEDLWRRGLETLVLDQTRPDTGLRVARVVVPGLRHFRARFAPGRLFDVPLRLGDFTEALEESQLNPEVLFM